MWKTFSILNHIGHPIPSSGRKHLRCCISARVICQVPRVHRWCIPTLTIVGGATCWPVICWCKQFGVQQQYSLVEVRQTAGDDVKCVLKSSRVRAGWRYTMNYCSWHAERHLCERAQRRMFECSASNLFAPQSIQVCNCEWAKSGMCTILRELIYGTLYSILNIWKVI